MTATEALARALLASDFDNGHWGHGPLADKLAYSLAALGYEVRSIDQPDLRAVRSGAQDAQSPAPIEQAAEASARETIGGAHRSEGEQSAGPTSAAADLDVEAVARIFADGRIDEFWDVRTKAEAFAAAYAAARAAK